MYICKVKTNSKIQIGGYNLKKYAMPGAQMKFYDIVSPSFWNLAFDNVLIGETPFYTRV